MDSYLYLAFDAGLFGPGATGTFDLYETRRTATGWRTIRRMTPSGQEAIITEPGGVAADHRYGFVFIPALNKEAGALEEGSYLSRPDGSFEPIGIGDLGTEPYAQGRYISPSAEHIIFTTGPLVGGVWCAQAGSRCAVKQLESNAAPTGTSAIYDRSPTGDTRVVSLLPGDVPLSAGQAAEYQGVSANGAAVAFKTGGTLYVRLDNTTTKSVTTSPATYAGLSADGERLFYVAGGNIYRFDTGAGTTEQVTTTADAKIVNISPDGTHVYFISASQLDGSEGTAGAPNLYLWAGSAIKYITTVSGGDLTHTSGEHGNYPALGNWTEVVTSPENNLGSEGDGPGANSSRTTPDGNVLIFESREQLTAFANDGHTEIYRFDALAGTLECVSCHPLGTPPTTDARLQELTAVWPGILIHNLSDDGSRVFFETSEALVARDTDGINDIYEWEESGLGSGELHLISTGKSVEYPSGTERAAGAYWLPNTIFSITPSGSDVVFGSLEQLTPAAGAGGVQAIYDARVNGGFPEAALPAPPCADIGSCHGAEGGSPVVGVPRSDEIRGKGNVKPRRCHRRRAKHKHVKPRRCHRRNSKKASSR